MNLQENIIRIKSMMGLLTENYILESTVGDNLNKTLLFEILKNSEYVQKFDYLWSPNLSVGADIIFVDLDEKDFFDKDKSVYEIIGELWPYDDYDKWKNLYYGLVYGYKIKDKNSDVNILVQVIRYEKSMSIGEKEFDFYINPNYFGSEGGEKIFIDDKIMNLFGFDDTESNNVKNDFSEMGEELSQVTKTMENYKIIFKYLDAVI
jgi:hypothetical protein